MSIPAPQQEDTPTWERGDDKPDQGQDGPLDMMLRHDHRPRAGSPAAPRHPGIAAKPRQGWEMGPQEHLALPSPTKPLSNTVHQGLC